MKKEMKIVKMYGKLNVSTGELVVSLFDFDDDVVENLYYFYFNLTVKKRTSIRKMLKLGSKHLSKIVDELFEDVEESA